MSDAAEHFDWVVVGSGFGGSVSALRLAEKGYSVLVVEKGRRFRSTDFPRTNWNLKRWLWLPKVGFRGFFKLTFLRHLTVLSGVGVGGGSLVYAGTLPVPKRRFFDSGSWRGLADWQTELAPHYQTALSMLGAEETPFRTPADDALAEVAADLGRTEGYGPTRVGIYFGEPGRTVEDPYFGGRGPARTGCLRCGGCMVGCRHGSKNSLDHNYLYLAEALGARIVADTRVQRLRPLDGGGFRVEAVTRPGRLRRRAVAWTADRVVLAGGVLGTVGLLTRCKQDPDGLPALSDRLGEMVRTNSESLTGVVSRRRDVDHSQGVAIGSILHVDESSHLEPVRYPAGSGFFRLLMAPHAPGSSWLRRLVHAGATLARRPLRWLQAFFTRDFARSTTILLFMRTGGGTLALRPGRLRRGALRSVPAEGERPTAAIPEASALAERMAGKLDGVVGSLLTETVFGIPTTAHILGGCCMGANSREGVIDDQHRVFGYDGLYVIDGSAISADPGVNPSLTIAALAERAMSRIEPRGHRQPTVAADLATPVLGG